MPVFCDFCGVSFRTDNALHQHCRDRADHPYCEDCERVFRSFNGLSQHRRTAGAHQDDEDDEDDFDSEYYSDSTEEIPRAPAGRFYAPTVITYEDDDEEDDYCKSCRRTFVNKAALYQHLADSPAHNWCFICHRDFRSEGALAQHNNSPVHYGRDLKCPLCMNMFKVPSAIALHLESGCHGFHRHTITAAVQSLPITNTISLSRRIAGPGGTRAPAKAITNYAASERSFNGSAYECFLCRRTFRTLSSLNSHLSSPAHDADEFTCPKCKRCFKLISGLVNHMESEVCGFARLRQVKDEMRALVDQFSGLLTL
ncbi:hypothetical protein EV121DRAFT_264670 [Schizophyllum commune]